MKSIFKVVQQGEAFAVQSRRVMDSTGSPTEGQTMKCNIVLQEIGGKFENQFIATLWGNAAQCKFYNGDLVVAALRFSTRDYNGQTYQDISVNDIYKLNK